MNDTPASAHALAAASSNLANDLNPINGQPGLTGMDAATDVAKHLSYVAEQLGLHTILLTQFVRNQVADGRVEVHPGLPPSEADEVAVATHNGLIYEACRTVTRAADTSARNLDAMHELMAQLATKDNLPERIGVGPALRSKGFAMNLLHAAVYGHDEVLRDLAVSTSEEEARELAKALEKTAKALSLAHGFDALSPTGEPRG